MNVASRVGGRYSVMNVASSSRLLLVGDILS